MSPDPDAIAHQQQLLATHRRTLAHLLQQAAQYGGEVLAPPQTANGLAEARAAIDRVKQELRAQGVEVADDALDTAPPAPDAPPRAGSAVEQYTIQTGGGDYAEGDIDQRRGTFLDIKLGGLSVRLLEEQAAAYLTRFLDQFMAILSSPHRAIQTQFAPDMTSRARIQWAVVYTATSILLGISFARFVGLPNSPAVTSPETALVILLIWILSATILHPFLKLFRAQGTLQDTVVVFLLVVSSIHLVVIPILAVTSRLVTDTRVTLTYDYVIYFGANDDVAARKGWPYGTWVGRYSESYVKESEPQRDTTIIPPADDLNSYDSAADLPKRPEDRPRVPLATTNLEPPARTEEPVVRAGIETFLGVFWLGYYLLNAFYLAAGLSIPHRRSTLLLFLLAIIGPICAMLVVFLALFVYMNL